MEEKRLTKKVKEIEMSKEIQQRIIKNCYGKMEETTMKKTNKLFMKPMALATTFAFCLCLTSVSALAVTGKLQGFFKDIIRIDGAVVGTTYEQATDEIDLNVIATSNELVVMVDILNPNKAPFSEFDSFGIKSYEIVDTNGNVVVKGNETSSTVILDGQATFTISLGNLGIGNYTLVVTEFVGNKKAEQPLVLSGTWTYEFTH